MKKLKKAIGFILIVAFGFSVYFYLNYVRVAPSLLTAYKQKDSQFLKNYFDDLTHNWYQRSQSLEFYSRLKCSLNDPLLTKVLGSHIHQNRLSVFSGCFKHVSRDFLVPRGLKDHYSYARYTTLKYIERRKIQDQYQDQLKQMIQTDSSSMVKNQAKLLLSID